jgi:transcriptional regulator with XRE-family HTH domain
MTQQEMADTLGMHRKTLIRHERSEIPPKSFVLAYSAATGVPVGWLIEGDDGHDGPSGQAGSQSACYGDILKFQSRRQIVDQVAA